MCKTYYKVDCKEAAWVVLELLYEAVLQACFLFYKDYGGGSIWINTKVRITSNTILAVLTVFIAANHKLVIEVPLRGYISVTKDNGSIKRSSEECS